MYFEKTSVSYKVPNHRIMDLQRKWKYKREGRRYNTASFIYAFETVCAFCSQLFNNEVEVESRKGLPDIEFTKSPKKTMKEFETVASPSPDHNMIKTEIKRQDIALGQRVYQSSTVDDLDATIAVTPNETQYVHTGSKTRREVDAWWEVDFGRPQHVHALSITLATAIQIPLKVRVLLLNGPLGFEDPFLDSVTKKAIITKDFELESGKSMAEMTTIEWDLPASTICVAARVQLYGIHTLFIKEFHAYQGNEVVDFSAADLDRTANSYASLSPQKMTQGWLEITKSNMLHGSSSRPGTKSRGRTRQGDLMSSGSFTSLPGSPSTNLDGGNSAFSTSDFAKSGKRSGGGGAGRRGKGSLSRDQVTRLSEQIRNQNEAIQGWKNRVLHSANYFSHEEIVAMRDNIFNVVCAQSGVQPVEAPVVITPHTHMESPQTSPMHKGDGSGLAEGSSMSVASGATGEDHHASVVVAPEKPVISYGIFDHELLDNALILYNPRGLLYNVSKRLRQVLRWIQSRERVKEVGALMFSDKFNALALDSADVLYKLSAAFNVVERGDNDSNSFKDCSWSQFLIIMHLTCIAKTNLIYKWGYPKSHFSLEPVSELEDHGPRSGRKSPHGPGTLINRSLDSDSNVLSSGSALFGGTSRCSTHQSNRGGTAGRGKEDYKSLTWNDILGADNPRPGSSAKSTFVAMKIGQLSSRMDNEYDFPKTLNEAVALAERNAENNKRAVLSSGAVKVASSKDVEAAVEATDGDALAAPDDLSLTATATEELKLAKTRPGTTAAVPGSPPMTASLGSPGAQVAFFGESNPFATTGDKSVHDSLHDQSMDDLLKGFDKTCALCVRTFPKKALEMKVLFKHVIALRRSWNPSLVPKVIEALDQSITMYNLVNVCAFCSQYFDPDFEGGIAFPQRKEKDIHPEGVIGKIVAEKHPLVEFLDDRHLDNELTNPFRIADFSTCADNNIKSAPSGSDKDSLDLSTTALPKIATGDDEWYAGLVNVSSTDSHDELSQLSVDSQTHGMDYLRSSQVSRSRARARKAVEISKELEKQKQLAEATAPADDED